MTCAQGIGWKSGGVMGSHALCDMCSRYCVIRHILGLLNDGLRRMARVRVRVRVRVRCIRSSERWVTSNGTG